MFTVYGIFGPDGALAYVGKTNDFDRRIGEHMRDRRKQLYNWLHSNAVSFSVLATVDTECKALAIESLYIGTFGAQLRNILGAN